MQRMQVLSCRITCMFYRNLSNHYIGIYLNVEGDGCLVLLDQSLGKVARCELVGASYSSTFGKDVWGRKISADSLC